MSWIALVGPEMEENLGLRYIASSLARAGFRAEIVPYDRPSDLPCVVAAIADAPEPPLLVGLSLAFQWRAKDFLALAMALREVGCAAHVTAGGHFATFAARDLLRDFPELDSIVRQEAEETVVSLARALAAGRPAGDIPGLALRDGIGGVVLTPQPALPDLARLPWPDRRGVPGTSMGHAIAPLVSSRGCYANCTFCCIAAWHEESQPGKRYRLRPVEDVADEMVAMQRERGIEVFIFHDDNFFVPGHRKNAERIAALADALEARGIGRFATAVKARPTDVTEEVFRLLKDRLQCFRLYVGVETDADSGLVTLGRWCKAKQNRRALEIIEALDIYVSFNLLVFDPDTTVADIEQNLDFMRRAALHPFNFGRVELYAGTPLLDRMQREGRATGDYLQWDYALADRAVERIFAMAVRAFSARNFGDHALCNETMGMRFDVEVARHFDGAAFQPGWRDEAQAISRALTLDTAAGLRELVEHAKSAPDDPAADEALAGDLALRLRRVEDALRARMHDLDARMRRTLGLGAPSGPSGDRSATPLQAAREVTL